MIQRIQSLFLLLGAVLMGAMPFIPQPEALLAAYPWFSIFIGVGCVLTALVALWAIFLYKNRKLQRRTIVWVQLLAVVMLAVLIVMLVTTGQIQGLYSAAGSDLMLVGLVVLPVIAYLLFYLARRAVDKDIALVASMDRIR